MPKQDEATHDHQDIEVLLDSDEPIGPAQNENDDEDDDDGEDSDWEVDGGEDIPGDVEPTYESLHVAADVHVVSDSGDDAQPNREDSPPVPGPSRPAVRTRRRRQAAEPVEVCPEPDAPPSAPVELVAPPPAPVGRRVQVAWLIQYEHIKLHIYS